MYLFDNLIFDDDRNEGNILYDSDSLFLQKNLQGIVNSLAVKSGPLPGPVVGDANTIA